MFAEATFLPMLGSIPFFGMFEEFFKGPAGNEVSYKLVFAIGVAIAIISKFTKQVKNQWKANTFYSISFATLMVTCGLLYMLGINIMYSAFVVGYLIKAIFGREETVKTRMHFLENIAFSFFIPISMNARGGPGIVLATVAYSYEIISLEFFTVLILTTMVSSMIAGYYLRLQQKRDAKVFDEL